MAQEDSCASKPTDASASNSTPTPTPTSTSNPTSNNPNNPLQGSSRHSSTPSPEPSSAPTAVLASAPHQNGDARSSSSPAMSNSHPPGPPRQPVGYPTPNSYASPVGGMPPTHYGYPASTSQPGPDVYRTTGGATIPLPSMRSIDPMQPQGQAPPAPQGLPLTMAIGPGQGMPYYSPQMPMHHNPYGMADPMQRYSLPPHDARLLGPRGPKKEIKRRTKTGCLTCRKRRIKCDETHPSCNNCKKSKRECLGYDPIFKQQQGPATIQPAPGSQSSHTQTLPSSAPAVSAPPSNPYGSQPAILPSSYGSSISSGPPFEQGLANPVPGPKHEGYEYSSTIDPALQNVPASASSISTHTNSSLGEPKLADNLHLRAKKMKIDEILDLLGPAAPAQETPVTEALFGEITRVYHEIYVPGLTAFFESKWFLLRDHHGNNSFIHHKPLLDQFAAFLTVLEKIKQNDHSQMTYSGILETRVVWALATLPYIATTEGTNHASTILPPEGDPTEARNRVRVVETLLCGDNLLSNPLTPPMPDSNPHRASEFEFWYTLAEFVRIPDEPDSNKAGRRDEVLGKLRQLLDGRENRDLIYSIAITRELAPRFEPGYENNIPQYLDESDPKNKLVVASKFIQDEAQTGGTTNIVRRVSEIAIRAFINPGVNIASRTASR